MCSAIVQCIDIPINIVISNKVAGLLATNNL